MAGWSQRVRASQQIGFNLFHAHRFLVGAALHSRMRQACAALLLLPILAFGQAQMSTPGSFSVSPMGAATYSIPIQVPPGTAGMQPNLSLNYNSQAGQGIAGIGWSLGGLSSITRCHRTIAQDGASSAITLTNADAFCLDGQRLMAVNGAYGAAGTEYRTEIESFSRIISSGTLGDGPYSFNVETKSGQIMNYQPCLSGCLPDPLPVVC